MKENIVNETQVTILHNARCSNSRGALELLRERGIEPNIIDYMKTPLTAAELADLFTHLLQCNPGMKIRDFMRSKETIYTEQGLHNPAISDIACIEAMAKYPVLINRPIVITPRAAALCRPPEKVLELI